MSSVRKTNVYFEEDEVQNSTSRFLFRLFNFWNQIRIRPVFSSSGFEFGLRWLDGDLTPPRVEG